MFKVGDTVRYVDTHSGNSEPSEAMVIEIKEQIKISYHIDDLQTIIWVDSGEIEVSDVFDCTHDAECGWCDGTGDCIYD